MAKHLTLEFEFRNKRFQDADKGLRAFATALKKDWDGSAKVLSLELRGFLDEVAAALADRHKQAWPGGTTPNTLSKRSGALLNSIIESVNVAGETFDTIKGEIGGSRIARVHEFGAVIKPKKAKYLTIPLPAALNSNGTPIKQSARMWDKTFVARTKAGNLVIFRKVNTKVVPLYVLKTSVKIPPRLGMQRTLEAGLPYFIDSAMDAMVRAVMASKRTS